MADPDKPFCDDAWLAWLEQLVSEDTTEEPPADVLDRALAIFEEECPP